MLTRRRHPADTALVAIGDAAREWLSIGQAYAGPRAGTVAPDDLSDCRRPGRASAGLAEV